MIMDDDGLQPGIFSARIHEFFRTVRIPVARFGIRLSATSAHDTLVLPAVPQWPRPGAPWRARFFARAMGIFRVLLAHRLRYWFPKAGVAGQLRRLVGRFPSEIRIA